MKQINKPKLVIFGFSGACTYETTEGNDLFYAQFIHNFVEELGNTTDEAMHTKFSDVWARIHQKPEQFGLTIDGKIVAHANVDATIEALVCAQVVLHELGKYGKAWDDTLLDLRRQCFSRYIIGIRPELLSTLKTLKDQNILTCVVSSDDPITAKGVLARIGDDHMWVNRSVYGYAKKFMVTKTPECVPEKIQLSGITRPVYLQRGYYYRVLEEIRSKHKLEWQDILVVSDNAEIDLLLPVILGAHGYLLNTINTPSYELDWARMHPSTRIIGTLPEICLSAT